jgi:hypothetical protein
MFPLGPFGPQIQQNMLAKTLNSAVAKSSSSLSLVTQEAQSNHLKLNSSDVPISFIFEHLCLLVQQDGSEVRWERASGPSPQPEEASSAQGNASAADIKLRMRAWCGEWAVPSAAFTPDAVGAKSLNTIKLRVRLYLHPSRDKNEGAGCKCGGKHSDTMPRHTCFGSIQISQP